MEKVKLNEVTWFQEGPGVRNTQYTESGVKLLNVANLVNGKVVLSNTSRFISEDEAFGKYKHFLCDDGDLIIASSGIKVEYLDKKMGFVTKDMLPLCMNTSTIRFKVKDKNQLDIKYLMYFFKSNIFKDQIQKLITGSAQLNYGPSHLNKVFIKMNTMNKQKEIVNKLDKITNMIENQEKMIKKYDDLIKSQFIEMFGGKYSTDLLKNVCEELFAGGDVKKDRYSKTKTNEFNIPIYTNGEKNDGLYGYTDKARVFKESVTISGRGTIGFTCLRKNPYYPAVRLLVAVPKNNIITSTYLKYFIESKNYSGNGVSIPQLTIPMIKDEKIHLPPIELQNQFADFVKHIDKLKFRETITKLKNLCYNIFNIIQSKNLSEVKK